MVLGRRGDVAGDGPEEADQLARDRDHGHLGWLAIPESFEPLVEALLRFPRVREDRGGLALLPALEVHADLGSMLVAPRRLDQDMAAVTVARLGNRAAAFAVAAGVFAGYQPEVARQLAWMLEPTPVDQLGREDHRRLQGNPAEALEPLDDRGERRGQRELFDRAIEVVTALQLVGEECVVLPEDEAILGREVEKSAFRRRLKGDATLEEVPGEFERGVQRPAQLYRASEGFVFEA